MHCWCRDGLVDPLRPDPPHPHVGTIRRPGEIEMIPNREVAGDTCFRYAVQIVDARLRPTINSRSTSPFRPVFGAMATDALAIAVTVPYCESTFAFIQRTT